MAGTEMTTSDTLRAPFPYFGDSASVPILCYNLHMKTEERFWSKVNKTDDCWLWTASKRNGGYGAFVYPLGDDIVQGRAHRYSWEIHYGLIPLNTCVLHRCDTPACVRPDHLWLGSKADNNADMLKKGRHAKGRYLQGNSLAGKYKRGADRFNTHLTPDIVKNIRDRNKNGESMSSLAREYKMNVGYIHRICHREVWKHVE